MRITIVTGPFLSIPPAPAGAVERRWSDVARSSAERGHCVRLICRAHPDLGRARKRDGVEIHPVLPFRAGTSMPLNLAKDLAYATRVLIALPRADILVTNTFFLPMLAWLRPAAGHVCVNVARVPKGQMRAYLRFGVARFHAVSSAIREEIIAECPDAAPRIRVIPNPIRTDVFRPGNGHPATEPVVLYTGRIHPEKGLDLLVTACRSLLVEFPTLRLKLMGALDAEGGGGGDVLRRELESLAGPLPLEIAPPVYDREALRREICTATLYAYPSVAEKGESFGIAPLEAMACGHAPVVSSLACFRDFLEDNRTALVFDHRGPGAAERLAACLRRQLRDPDERAAMGHAAAERARDFSVEAIAEQYLADFKELLAKGAKR
jgi:glycosyltransferase involved in cell wall biosynthesis